MKTTDFNIIIPSILPEGSMPMIKSLASELDSEVRMVSKPVVEPVFVISAASSKLEDLGDVLEILHTMRVIFNIRVFSGSQLVGVWIWRKCMPTPIYYSGTEVEEGLNDDLYPRGIEYEASLAGLAMASVASRQKPN